MKSVTTKWKNIYPHILRRYMGEERDGGFEYYDKTTKEAADICGASQSSSYAAKRTEPVNRKERAEYSEQVKTTGRRCT